MKAFVFAAGIGSRLKPFTDSHPKALAPIGNSTAVASVIDKLIDAGADGIVVNVHHFAEQLTSYLANRYGDIIEISDETDCLLETGGAIAKAARNSRVIAGLKADEPLIVHNADIITDFSIADMCHTCSQARGAVLVNPNRTTNRHLMFDADNFLCGWENTSTGKKRPADVDLSGLTATAFGGVHCLTRDVIDAINDYCGEQLHPFSIIDFYIDRCCGNNTIKAFMPAQSYRWFDIGTPEKLAQAQASFSSDIEL